MVTGVWYGSPLRCDGGRDHVEVRGVDQPLRLQGQYHDSESNLHYNRYRYFDPQTGYFISQDPIGLEVGGNPYQFAPNLFGWIDPFGLKKESCRLKYVGRTPEKKSKAGREVIERMRKEGRVVGKGKNMRYKASDGKWYPMQTADMAHKRDAVEY